MSKIREVIYVIHDIDGRTEIGRMEQRLHPLSKMTVTFLYILLVLSFPQYYNILGLAGMVIYLLVIGIWNSISVKQTIRQIGPVFLLVGMIGIANPLIDRQIYLKIGEVSITFGMISMISLMLKGIFSVIASYYLILTTGMKEICYGLRSMHVPKELVTVLLLIYRYLMVLLKEAERMLQAYSLRGPGQKGIHMKAWGTFVGQLLLRSVDRADAVYESMLLRGYHGEFPGCSSSWKKGQSILYFFGWAMVLLFLRFVPIFELVGHIWR